MNDQATHPPPAALVDVDTARMRELLPVMHTVLDQIGAYIYTKDAGELFYILGRTTAIRDEAGQITHWQGVLTDVTQRWRAEVALADAIATLQAARLEARR